MFVDTSAIIAIILDEPEQEKFSALLERVSGAITAPHVRLEAALVLTGRLDISTTKADQIFESFMSEMGVKIMDFTDAMARIAVVAAEKYGKGTGHPAQLNFGDCLSYAIAKQQRMPILFKGNDFSKTDLKSAR